MTLKNKRLILILATACVCVLAFVLYRAFFSWQFTKSYETYATLSAQHVTAAFLPATNDNQIRQELNRMLSDVLAVELPVQDRLERAQRGLLLLAELEKQIDAIGDKGEAVSHALGELESHASGADRAEIVSLALERMRVIGDIRGLSYRANYHTAEIFNRVISDGGSLTDEHISELNAQVPLVEEQFDRRSGLYSELESINSQVARAYKDLPLF